MQAKPAVAAEEMAVLFSANGYNDGEVSSGAGRYE